MITAITLTEQQSSIDMIEHELERDPRLASPNSRRGYLSDLARFETWRAGRRMSKTLVEEYASQLLGEGKSPNSINRSLAAVRWWARRLADLAIESPMPKEQREEFIFQSERISRLKNVKGERPHRGRHIADDEIAKLIEACIKDKTCRGIRDTAIICLAIASGMRRSEIAELHYSNFVRVGDEKAELRVHGKGNKVRLIPLNNGALLALSKWLAVRGVDDGPMFYAITRGDGVMKGHGLSDEALAQMLAKRVTEAEIDQHTTWHDFRRSFAGNLLTNGVDISITQKLMGHASPVTTSIYDRRPEELKRRAIQTIRVPYAR